MNISNIIKIISYSALLSLGVTLTVNAESLLPNCCGSNINGLIDGMGAAAADGISRNPSAGPVVSCFVAATYQAALEAKCHTGGNCLADAEQKGDRYRANLEACFNENI